MATTTTLITALLLALIGSSVIVVAVWLPVRLISHAIWFATKRPGTATPADAGLTYSEYWISNGKRRLQAWLVRATANECPETVIVLFQGGNRVISELIQAQKYLFEHGLSSMVFDFGGNGSSTGRANRDAIRDDGVAVISKLHEIVGSGTRVFLCGFSRSAGRTLAAINEGHADADGVILFGAYTTTREVMLEHLKLVPRWLGNWLFPVYWDNLTSIRAVHCPVLIVHSTDDELVSISQSQRLRDINAERVQFATVSGLKHDDTLHPLHEEYWQPVFEFISNARKSSFAC